MITDHDVWVCRTAGYTGIMHSSAWRLLWSFVLGRQLTMDETYEILGRINGHGPHQKGETYADIERNIW